jgi:antitoxin MazE
MEQLVEQMMKAAIIKIGNSHGIRIPKPIIDHCGFKDEVELEVREHELIIRREEQPRKDWAKSFQKMAEMHDDVLIETPSPEWDDEEWEWQ